GHTNGWRMDDVVPAGEIVAAIDREMPIEPVAPNYTGEVAKRWRYRDGRGERRRDRRAGARDLVAARRPLLGAPQRGDAPARQGRDELHRRMSAQGRPGRDAADAGGTRYRPVLTHNARPATFDVEAVDENGQRRDVSIAGEHPLTIYVDKQELLTLMTLGAAPEALTIGYLRNQRLVNDIRDIVAVQVDWDTESVAVKTRGGLADLAEKTAK